MASLYRDPKQTVAFASAAVHGALLLRLVHTLGGEDLVGQHDILVILDFLLPDGPGRGKFIDIALILNMKTISSDSS